jgi:hypothetical protein
VSGLTSWSVIYTSSIQTLLTRISWAVLLDVNWAVLLTYEATEESYIQPFDRASWLIPSTVPNKSKSQHARVLSTVNGLTSWAVLLDLLTSRAVLLDLQCQLSGALDLLSIYHFSWAVLLNVNRAVLLTYYRNISVERCSWTSIEWCSWLITQFYLRHT